MEVAVDLLAEGITPLLDQITCDFQAGTMAGLGVNGGNPLPYEEWMAGMVEAGAETLPIAGDDPAMNQAVLDLLVSVLF